MEEIITTDRVDEPDQLPHEEGIEIPLARISLLTLRKMLSEFVTREWADEACPPETRMEQVLLQLREKKAKVVYDFTTETWNIVSC